MESKSYQRFWFAMTFMLSFLTGVFFLFALLVHDAYHVPRDNEALSVGGSILESIPDILKSIPHN